MTALTIAAFAEAERFRDAIVTVKSRQHIVVGAWSPLPVEGVELIAARRGIVPALALVGLSGAVALYLLEYVSLVHLYPFDSGLRPLHSWQTFLIAPIEFGALAAAFGGIAMFLRRAHLPRLHHPAFDIAEVEAASRDRFVIAVRCDAGEDAARLLALLAEAGAVHTRLVTP